MSAAPLFISIPLALLLIVLAAAAGILAARGRSGSLQRTDRLGVHTPAAIASDEAFSLANKVAAPVSGGAAVVAGVVAVLVVVLPAPTTATIVIALVGLAGSLALLVAAGVLGDRAARQVPIPARRPGSAETGCSGCACGGGGCAGISRTNPAAAAGSA